MGLGAVLATGETSLNELIDIEAFDGRRKTIQNSVAPIRNAEGAIVGVVIVNEDVTERVRDQKALHESAERLQHLSRRLLEVQEEEHRHLARELHDEYGQILSAITLHLHAARSLAGEAARSRLDECAALLRQAGERVRSLVLELRPTMLDNLGLEATLRLARRAASATDRLRSAGRGPLSGSSAAAGSVDRLLPRRAGIADERRAARRRARMSGSN